ncbi:GntR family transcriptional regulator [Aurantimonas sp. C2-6-R+9]|uniref:GntR family transcriptional regulator n=1 Tax=unclassified Aurantimonas TaxID=2638230 RepID=UPI002E184704|nr:MULTISPECIES: GntR family transcriptional regulator [unclassified Aurantimonas]MEC5290626.1 GntR family transcriptional regulator [Aurantimonas sp. C2-3-R2]MEC5380660.1 GntR family transcriptional regulator [Aurantimonas sp. C2-6-R+9]MEC5411706.1 GntR family transcriptional regulator [Aurantimonas sp. C2-4-R8]
MVNSKRESRRDVYARIRQMILAGEIAMGDRLVEARLAQRLEMSRTPLLDRLEDFDAFSRAVGIEEV